MKQYSKLRLCKSARSSCNSGANSMIHTFAGGRSIPQLPQIVETYCPVIGRRRHQICVHRVHMNTVDLYTSNTPRFLQLFHHNIQSNTCYSLLVQSMTTQSQFAASAETPQYHLEHALHVNSVKLGRASRCLPCCPSCAVDACPEGADWLVGPQCAQSHGCPQLVSCFGAS